MAAKTSQLTDKKNEPIHITDVVSAKSRGGKYAGEVTDIVMTTEEAEGIQGIDVGNPPKEDQHGEPRPRETETEGTDNSWQAIKCLIIQKHLCMGMILESKGPVNHS
jgi:hypothetical protein